MDLHKQYMDLCEIEISILEDAYPDFKKDCIQHLDLFIQRYSNDIIEAKFDLKTLKALRMFLCRRYQLYHENQNVQTDNISNSNLRFSLFTKVFHGFCLKLNKQKEELKVFCDIVVLQLILYSPFEHIKNYFDYINTEHRSIVRHGMIRGKKNEIGTNIVDNNEVHWKMKESFLDYLRLQKFLNKNIDTEVLKDMCSRYTKTFYNSMSEVTEWTLISYVLKAIDVFGSENVLMPIWQLILNKPCRKETSLMLICGIIDVCCPPDPEDFHYKMYSEEKFWHLLLDCLKLPTQQYQKQAVFIMKKVLNMIHTFGCQKFQLKENSIIPFACDHSHAPELANDFFLIIEALEEKQTHLIMPSLSRLTNLITLEDTHCLNTIWLRHILTKTLSHENNITVRWGILQYCKLHVNLYDDEFLSVFTEAFNNTSFYECNSDEDLPEVMEELSQFLIRAQKQKVNFICEFLQHICRKYKWGPIPMFYVTQAVYKASCQITDNVSCFGEVQRMQSDVLSHLTTHSRILRRASEINILKIFMNSMNSMKEIDNMEYLAMNLHRFPFKEIFTKNSHCWNVFVARLKQILSKPAAINFVKEVCNKRRTEIHYVCMIFLLYDADLICHEQECIAQKALRELFCTLDGIRMRPYANVADTLQIISFMCNMESFIIKDQHNHIFQLLAMYIEPVLQFLQINIKNTNKILDCYYKLQIYCNAITSFLYLKNPFLSDNKVVEHVKKFNNECLQFFVKPQRFWDIRYYCALYVLHHCQNILLTWNANSEFRISDMLCLRPIQDMREIRQSDFFWDEDSDERQKILSDNCVLQAKIIYQYVKYVPRTAWPQDFSVLENCVDIVGECPSLDPVPIVAKILQIYVDKQLITLHDEFKRTFKICWDYAFTYKKESVFWDMIEELLKVIINSKFLTLPNGLNFVESHLNTVLEQGENMPGLKKLLISNIEKLDQSHIKNFQEPLLACLLHGYALRRDKRIENQAYRNVMKNYAEYMHHISIADYNDNAAVRANATVLLFNTIENNSEFISSFLKLVLAQLEKTKNKRYFNDSQLHRVKHRLMQVLLILQPTLDKSDTIILHDTLCELILAESNQHSVRLMQEWLLVRIYLKDESLHCKLWEIFEKCMIERPRCATSMTSVIYHIARILSDTNTRKEFIEKSISYVTSCCLGPQFNVRLYSQLVFMKLYELSQELDYCNIVMEYKGFRNAINKTLDQKIFAKKLIDLQNNFFFTVFDPINDYTLQTIYYELPRLCNMEIDEWVMPDLFKYFNFTELVNHPLKLYNPNEFLAHYETAKNSIDSSEDRSNMEGSINDTVFDDLNDVQRKISPLQFLKLSKNGEIKDETIIQKEDNLIIVASLIDKLPNLGGLARTCEIFGVKEFVIANCNDVKNKEFQSLSVTAEKWINIVEVKPQELKNYLLEKKNSGWALLGVEQTVKSKNLTEMKFKKKSLLVLGNEKNGIPANLIPILDMCIEIPQFGVIRSLNVHVTAAICIWQYINQHEPTKTKKSEETKIEIYDYCDYYDSD